MFACSSPARIWRLMRSFKLRIWCVRQRKRTVSSAQFEVMRRMDIGRFNKEVLLNACQFRFGHVGGGAAELVREKAKSSIQQVQDRYKCKGKKQFSSIVVIDAEKFDASNLNGFAIPDELYEWAAHDAAHS